ncbi:MAG: hypothetical protein RIE83_12245 [Thalassobaculaceae bacterium]
MQNHYSNIEKYFLIEKYYINKYDEGDVNIGVFHCCSGISQVSSYVSMRLSRHSQNERFKIRISSDLIFQGFVAEFFDVNTFVLEWVDDKALPKEWREWAYGIADAR